MGNSNKHLTPPNIPEPWQEQCLAHQNTILQIFSDEEVQIEEQPSQIILENNPKEDSESERSSLHSVVVESFYTCFPTLCNFKSLYFSKQNFKGPVDALTFINSWFHLSKIHDDILSFPDLARDPIYNYTSLNNYLFPSLQQHIKKWPDALFACINGELEGQEKVKCEEKEIGEM